MMLRSENYQLLNMNSSSLPAEILAIIVEDVISECAETKPKDSYQRFIPRWYLTPLLRVCKLWYAVCTKYLYKSIAVGSDAPLVFPARRGENYYTTLERRLLYIRQATQKIRKGHEVVEDLYRTLATNTRLAAFVRKLQLGSEIICHPQEDPGGAIPPPIHKPEWTQTFIHILQLCPNVEDVEICGFEKSELDALVDVLKEKSLVSFRISTRYLSVARWGEGGSFLQLLDMMQQWPKLRSIWVDEFLDNKMAETSLALDTSQFSDCCPDLREIIFTRFALHASEYTAFRAMCSGGITKLDVSLYGIRESSNSNAAVDALSECLRAWSLTLEYLRIGVLGYLDSYRHLNEAISTLGVLRELQLDMLKLDFGSISSHPRLERFACRMLHNKEELQTLCCDLEDLQKFPSLNHIVLEFGWQLPKNLQNVSRERNIRLGQSQRGCHGRPGFLL